jgi:hypothetical protein
MGYDCFISYASSDHAIAAKLSDRIAGLGLRVWFDKARLLPGCDWHREIEQYCEESRIVLPVLTPRWKLSDWTRYETYGAEAVIPLVCEGEWKDVCTRRIGYRPKNSTMLPAAGSTRQSGGCSPHLRR